MSLPEVIARHFGAAAPHYDQHARLQRDVADTLFGFLPPQPDVATVLDLGCGTGYCSERLRRRLPDCRLLCLDLALPMLKRSALRGVDGSLVCADAAALPFAEASIDLVFSSLAIQWCEDLPRLFAEVARVLRPGGLALFSTFGPTTLQELREAWAEVDGHRHVNDFTPAAALLAAARGAGLQVELHEEVLHEYHASLQALGRSLKAIGAQHLGGGRAPGLVTPRRYQRAAERFRAQGVGEGGVPVTWHLYYLILRLGD